MTMSKELVEGLLKGSAVLDQQKKDIHTILHMIFWLLKPEEIHGMILAKSSGSSLTFHSTPYWWRLEKSGRTAFNISLNCTIGSRMLTIYETKSHILAPPEYSRVQRVIDFLPLLLGELVKTFPQLKERMKPFLDAAQLTFVKQSN